MPFIQEQELALGTLLLLGAERGGRERLGVNPFPLGTHRCLRVVSLCGALLLTDLCV